STTNHQPSDDGGRDLAEDLLGVVSDLYRRPSPERQKQTWMRMKEGLYLRRTRSARSYRVGRVAIAASLLIITVGLGGYAAGRGGLTIQALMGTPGQSRTSGVDLDTHGTGQGKADQLSPIVQPQDTETVFLEKNFRDEYEFKTSVEFRAVV